jgi:hypothetical protein
LGAGELRGGDRGALVDELELGLVDVGELRGARVELELGVSGSGGDRGALVGEQRPRCSIAFAIDCGNALRSRHAAFGVDRGSRRSVRRQLQAQPLAGPHGAGTVAVMRRSGPPRSRVVSPLRTSAQSTSPATPKAPRRRRRRPEKPTVPSERQDTKRIAAEKDTSDEKTKRIAAEKDTSDEKAKRAALEAESATSFDQTRSPMSIPTWGYHLGERAHAAHERCQRSARRGRPRAGWGRTPRP